MTTVQTNTVSSSLLAAMNGTSSTSGTGSTSGTSSTSSSSDTSSAQAIQNQFMTLLVTQMQNQDPLNPMDSSQMTSQLAQISTVSGVNNLNTTLQALSDSYQSGQSIEAAGMIGKGVLVPGSSMQLTSGSGAVFGMNLSAAASDVKVSVLDGSGHTVRTIDLGAQDAGAMAFQWDGNSDSGAAAAGGSYTFSIAATNNGTKISADTLSYGQVDSVTRNSQGVKVNVANIGPIDLDQVQQIL